MGYQRPRRNKKEPKEFIMGNYPNGFNIRIFPLVCDSKVIR